MDNKNIKMVVYTFIFTPFNISNADFYIVKII